MCAWSSFIFVALFSISICSSSRPRRQVGEARIILPKTTNDGTSLSAVQSEFETKLHQEFGGFTRSEAQGSWSNGNQVYNEGIWVYDIAIPATPANKAKLEVIATWLKSAAQQLELYVRYPDGTIPLIENATKKKEGYVLISVIPEDVFRQGVDKVDNLISCSRYDGPAGCWHNNERRRETACRNKPLGNKFEYPQWYWGTCYCCVY